jgi:hypothetical protein
VFVIADSVPVIFKNHGIRVRGGIGFYVNIALSLHPRNFAWRFLLALKTKEMYNFQKAKLDGEQATSRGASCHR